MTINGELLTIIYCDGRAFDGNFNLTVQNIGAF